MLRNLSRWIGPDPAGEEAGEEALEEARPEATTFEFDDSEGIPDNLLVRLLNKPRLVIGMALTLCAMATVTYAGLGLYWLSGSPQQEAVAMTGVDETVAETGQARDVAKSTPVTAVATAADDTNVSVKKMDENEILAMAGIADEAPAAPVAATGRPDPFAPLVAPPADSSSGTAPAPEEEGPRDPLEFLQYTGYIGELKSKDKVAIVRINDGIQDYTVVKKAGETFTVNGEVVTLKSIGPEALHLKVAGASRRLDLNPYVEITASSSGSTTPVGASTGATTGGGSAASGNASAGGTGGSSDPTNPRLAEPSMR